MATGDEVINITGEGPDSEAIRKAREIFRTVKDSVLDPTRAALGSKEGQHRPHTKTGGYNRVSHRKTIQEDVYIKKPFHSALTWNWAEESGDQKKPREKRLSGILRDDESASRSGSRLGSRAHSRGQSRNSSRGGDKQVSFEVREIKKLAQKKHLDKTIKGAVSGDWPYNRGSTPQHYYPLNVYVPVDTRDENGAAKDEFGTIRSRHYVSANQLDVNGGYLSGLPRAGEGFRPLRVCGPGVVAAAEEARKAKELDYMKKKFGNDQDAIDLYLRSQKKKDLMDVVSLDDQLETGVVNMAGGNEFGKPLEGLPMQLTQGRPLTEIILSSNKLSLIPDTFCNHKLLRNLEIDNNGLEALPSSIGIMRSLQHLSARNNRLTRVPNSLAESPKLLYLDLSANHFRNFPEPIAQLTQLQSLMLATNLIETETSEFMGNVRIVKPMCSIEKLLSLRSLNLDQNKLTVVPVGLASLTNIKALRLRSNHIGNEGTVGITKPVLEARSCLLQITQLAKNLTFLDIGSNNISEFPAELCKLTGLTTLDLSKNQITLLPEDVVHLKSLRTLHVDRNPIRCFPQNFAHMPWLAEITSKDTILSKDGSKAGQGSGGGTVGSWRRNHAPIDANVFKILGKYAHYHAGGEVDMAIRRSNQPKPSQFSPVRRLSQMEVAKTLEDDVPSWLRKSKPQFGVKSMEETPENIRRAALHGRRARSTELEIERPWDPVERDFRRKGDERDFQPKNAPHPSGFQYWSTSAVTPYVPIQGLQGL